MKKLLFILPLLSLISVAHASAGISPNGDCETFTDQALPSDYRAVSSCDQVKQKDRLVSLEDRLRARFSKKFVQFDTEKKTTRDRSISAKYLRAGRGYLTKSAPAVSAETRRNLSDKVDRTSTRRNFQSIYRTYNLKNGTREDKEATSPRKAYQRPGYRSRSVNADPNEKLSATPQWKASTRSHFREKNYGSNPYSLSSVRSAQQRAFRAERLKNAKVDVKGRSISRTRTWRPDRIIGDLGGSAEWLKQQAEERGDLLENLNDQD